MVTTGSPLPDATVFAGPREPVSLRETAAGSKALFVFYLFDFSAT